MQICFHFLLILDRLQFFQTLFYVCGLVFTQVFEREFILWGLILHYCKWNSSCLALYIGWCWSNLLTSLAFLSYLLCLLRGPENFFLFNVQWSHWGMSQFIFPGEFPWYPQGAGTQIQILYFWVVLLHCSFYFQWLQLYIVGPSCLSSVWTSFSLTPGALWLSLVFILLVCFCSPSRASLNFHSNLFSFGYL